MHRDEVIYARSDARGVTLTPEEAGLVLGWYPGDRAVENPDARALAARLEAASTTPSP